MSVSIVKLKLKIDRLGLSAIDVDPKIHQKDQKKKKEKNDNARVSIKVC